MLLLALLGAAAPQLPCAVAQERQAAPIQLEADSSDIDRKNNRLKFFGVRISQDDLAISADVAEAQSLDFTRSTWTFTGDVSIDGEGTRIRADEASLHFVDHRLHDVRLSGEPVRFERPHPDGSGTTEGQARLVEYDFGTAVLRLTGDAWLREDGNRITGNSIIYNITDERVLAGSDEANGERVHIVITPPEGSLPDARRPGEDTPDEVGPPPEGAP